MKTISRVFFNFPMVALLLLTGCSKKEADPSANPDLPQVTTTAITDITKTSAICGGKVLSQGNSAVLSRGICWDTVGDPTINCSIMSSGAGTGLFLCHLHGLIQNTRYYVRAYAINEAGTGYGEQQTFKTAWDSGFATVITYDPFFIFSTSVDLGGDIIESGGSPVTERGFCWGTSPNPVTSTNHIACGSGTGDFYTNITGLTINTNYYARAYAINSAGTAYGNQVEFFTAVLVYPALFVPGNYQGWNPTDSATAIFSPYLNEKYEGYLWFPANTEYLFAKHSWDPHWGDNNADGTLELNGANIAVTDAGYYKLNADLVSLTHSHLRTEWGVIGSATVNGWNSDINMVYNSNDKVWRVTVDLTADDIKFRANDSWDLNYGDNNADGKLQQSGANIHVPVAGNYTITMDLSKAIYKYTLKKN